MSPIRKSEIRKKSRIFRKVYVSGTHERGPEGPGKVRSVFLVLVQKIGWKVG